MLRPLIFRLGLSPWRIGCGGMVLLWFACPCATPPLRGADEGLEYNRDIRPILAEHCFTCHGPDSAARKADLRLDQREAAIASGAITPDKPEESELVTRICSDDAELIMPPLETKKSLTPPQKQRLRDWIAAGAEYQPHWSFIPPHKASPPAVQNEAWVKNPIDRFVLAKLESLGLPPAPPADARTLFRRLHLDITGLPPTPEMMQAFVADFEQHEDEALALWIDRLMQLPAWGEHRARYWLDAARYGDTHGLHFDNYREMWPYRDWVIRAFNQNQPFDQFTIEQIAGDLLPHPSDDQLIATGFQRCNMTTNEGGTIDEENLAIYAADRVQTLGWVYLGLTTNCGQCHNHKFDPFTMRDYYSLAAFFRNTTQPPKDGNVKDGGGPVLTVPNAVDAPRWAALPNEIAEATSRRDQHKQAAQTNFEQWLASASAEPLDQGLPQDQGVVHVLLNEGSGTTIANRVAPANPIPLPANATWNADGKLGPALVIQSNHPVDLGDLADFEKDQSFSYGAWIKSAKDRGTSAILARMDEGASYRGWDLFQQDRVLAVHLIDQWPDNAIKVLTQHDVLSPGKWQHVFVTYDGSGQASGVKIYVDGAEVPVRVETNTLQPSATIRAHTTLRLGQRSSGWSFEGGSLQDVRIYQRTLLPAEVTAIATLVPVRVQLQTPAAQRTPEQQAALLEHYLVTYDQEYPSLAKRVIDLQAEREAIRARSPVTHIQMERPDSPAMAHVLVRGEYDRPTDRVDAATPAALHPFAPQAPRNRLGLAQWLVDPANPLTARVTVNRFWQQVFGRGIVLTTEDLGVMGATPTHPELLDWLAVEFRESGWDVKGLFKLMLTSATYRQAAYATSEKLEKDRDNQWLSRGPRFRMDAEMVRDYALATSGLLSAKLYGPSVRPYQPGDLWNIVGLPGGDTREYVQDTGESLYRRTVYTFWKRMSPPPNLEAFNAPSREVCTVRRERTNTPLQALVTLNDPQFVEAARHLAQIALRAGGADDRAVLAVMANRVLGRSFHPAEDAILQSDLHEFQVYYEAHPDQGQLLVEVGDSPVDPSLPVPRLAAWTMLGNEILNLDEVLNK